MSIISIDHVTKSFGSAKVIKEFDAEFKDGEFITLLGPSGCGKTTMLRMIAGFERSTTGEIRINGKVVSSETTFVPPEKREIGMVFQSYAVWPHMNVFDNVAYPLKIKKRPKEEIKKKVDAILETVHLSQYADRMPSQLSGGQQQRVALGRALVAEPALLLLDEPLSNLDAKLREQMRFEIKDLQKKLGINVVYVTHDQSEAMTMSDRIFVLNGGVVQQVGHPLDIYRHPKNQFVADFVGKINFLKGQVENGRIHLDGIEDTLAYDGPVTGRVEVGIRPENIYLASGSAHLHGTVTAKFFVGDVNDLRVQVGEESIRMVAPAASYEKMQIGDVIGLTAEEFMVFPESKDDFSKILT